MAVIISPMPGAACSSPAALQQLSRATGGQWRVAHLELDWLPAPKISVEGASFSVPDTAEGKVHLGPLGQYLKRTDPAFSPQTYGHSGLLDMLRTYDLLTVQQEAGNYWTVRLAPPAEATLTTAN